MSSPDGEQGPGRARRAGTSRMNLVGLQAFESPSAPRPLQRTHGPTPLLHPRAATVPGAHELTIGSCLNCGERVPSNVGIAHMKSVLSDNSIPLAILD